MKTCFECGAILPPNTMKCTKCGYMPDTEFMRKCPNMKCAVCMLSGTLCRFLGDYQTCPTKNEADRNSF